MVTQRIERTEKIQVGIHNPNEQLSLEAKRQNASAKKFLLSDAADYVTMKLILRACADGSVSRIRGPS